VYWGKDLKKDDHGPTETGVRFFGQRTRKETGSSFLRHWTSEVRGRLTSFEVNRFTTATALNRTEREPKNKVKRDK